MYFWDTQSFTFIDFSVITHFKKMLLMASLQQNKSYILIRANTSFKDMSPFWF